MDAVEPYAEDCEHAEKVFAIRTIKGGTRQVGTQCLQCGEFRPMRRTALPLGETLVEYDATLRENYHERKRRFYQRRAEQIQSERQLKSQAWWDDYNAYLTSEDWFDKRQRVLDRDDWICQACRKRRANQVHHLTYEHAFHEPLFDLVSICEVCHRALTEMDRCKRTT